MKDILTLSDALDDKTLDRMAALELEASLLINDCNELRYALQVYILICEPDYFANALIYSNYSFIIQEALVYRIVIGFSRLFDVNNKSRTVRRLMEILRQEEGFRTDVWVQKKLSQLIELTQKAQQEYNFRELRDKFFAHLDKESVFTPARLQLTLEYTSELMLLLDEIVEELTMIGEHCFPEGFSKPDVREIEVPDFRNMVDFEQRADRLFTEKGLGVLLSRDTNGLHRKRHK